MEEVDSRRGPAGYRHHQYAESFRDFATPLHLPRSNGWLLLRQIPATPYWDAMGSYPLFCCDDWSELARDLADIRKDLVSIVIVAEPFGGYTRQNLETCFDNVRHFKDHYVVDLARPLQENVSKSNRATARRALRKVQVRILSDPAECIDNWMDLYDGMIQRQNLTGLRKSSRNSFLKQLKTPGAMMFEATFDGQIIGLDMIYVDGKFAYGHLCAFSELGYKLRASYATRWRILESLEGRVRFLDFGGSVGSGADPESDSLAAYKRRWCAETKPVFLCSSILNPEIYDRLSRRNCNLANDNYFPAYRVGEF